MDADVKLKGRGKERWSQCGHLRTEGEGGQKLAKSCGRLLWMALYIFSGCYFDIRSMGNVLHSSCLPLHSDKVDSDAIHIIPELDHIHQLHRNKSTQN